MTKIIRILLYALILTLTIIQLPSQSLNRDSIRLAFEAKEIADQKEMLYEYGGSATLDSSDIYFIADLMESVEGTPVELKINRVSAISMRGNAMYTLGRITDAMEYYKDCLRTLDTIFLEITPEYEKYSGLRRMQSAYNLNIGLTLNGLSRSKEGLEYLDKALVLAKEIDNAPFIRKILTTKGNIFNRIGDHSSAAEYFLEAMKVEDEKETVFLAETNRSLGNLYLTRGQPEIALDYFSEGLDIIKRLQPELTRSVHIVQALSGMHQYYFEIKDYRRSDSILQEILKVDPERVNYYSITYRFFTEALLQSEQGNFEKAFSYLDEAEKLIPEDHEETLGVFYLYKAKVLKNKNSFASALRFAQESLKISKDSKTKTSVLENYKLISDIEFENGDFRSSRQNLEKYLVLYDSLQNDKIILNQDILSVKYEIEKKEKELQVLKAGELENSVKLTQKNNFIKGMVGGSTLLGLLVLSLLRNNKRKNENNRLLQEKNDIIKSKSDQNVTLLKEIHHRVKNNLQIISSLLYLQSDNIKDSDAKDAIFTGQQRVESMALIHKNLYQKENLTRIEMKEFIFNLTTNLKNAYLETNQKVSVKIKMDNLELDVDQAIPLGLIINELITNAFKYAFGSESEGILSISLSTNAAEKFVLRIKDSGPGKYEITEGFGTQLIQLLTNQLGATMTEGNDNGYWCQIAN